MLFNLAEDYWLGDGERECANFYRPCTPSASKSHDSLSDTWMTEQIHGLGRDRRTAPLPSLSPAGCCGKATSAALSANRISESNHVFAAKPNAMSAALSTNRILESTMCSPQNPCSATFINFHQSTAAEMQCQPPYQPIRSRNPTMSHCFITRPIRIGDDLI